ncbi:MAG: pyrroline-5-carboxylate reductase [Planctomycetota bacterium]
MSGVAAGPMAGGGVAMIGGGRMASALAEGFCRAGLLAAEAITVYDPAAAAREALAASLPGVRFVDTPAAAAAAAEIVWLAVKPQQAADACAGIAAVMPGRTLVSILAGLSTTALRSLSGTSRVIRVMPNTPCLVGRGVSVVCQTPDVPAAIARRVTELLAAVGHVHAADESLLNAVTGLSGSGPGFLALVAEALAAGGERAGLPRPLALALAVQTLEGTGALLDQTGEEPAVIRDRVSSPGGTTLAGLAVLTERGVPEALAAAVEAAAARAAVLGR